MKTLKIENGDFVFDEKGELAMVEGDEEIAQGVEMSLSIRKDEFELDEYIGLDRTNVENKQAKEEEIIEDILEALQVMTDQNLIEGADNIEISKEGRMATVSMDIIKTDGTDIKMEGVDISGSQ
ncbi:DUF2634 domain-containing protein [Peribacillus asahii]|uniref:DUF2634 domain-containing protein n=1 Tax=Peribacillus asahii TaxID=228899 RepID=UPI00207A4A3C|nr:DUF2634 domain-containing protein [Peribacillus asahii]USK71771.1 DUF2634 domain-containing protein [Peribacillus asahii]